jgi:carboxyl-terminal processing protease
VDFAFAVAPKTKDDMVVVELQVYDSTLGETVSEKLKYPLRAASAGPKSAKGNVRVTQSTSVFEGANDTSAFIAKAAKGTVFKVTGQAGKWLRVQLAPGQPGFILSDTSKKVKAGVNLAGLDTRMQVTPPTLNLKVTNYETSAATYSLKGTASDDSKVEDVYIFVSNREAKVESRKVFYRSNRAGPKAIELNFDAELPLWPGSNAVTVVARENDGVRTIKTLYINRVKAKTASAN